MVIGFLSWKSALRVSKIVRDTKTEVGLDSWRRLNHKYYLRNPFEKYSVAGEVCSRRRKLAIQTWLQAWRGLEQELRALHQRFGDDVQNFWTSIHMACIQKICPEIFRDHFAVQSSSIDSLEKQRLTIEKFLQTNVHGSGNKSSEQRVCRSNTRTHTGTRTMLPDTNRDEHWHTASSKNTCHFICDSLRLTCALKIHSATRRQNPIPIFARNSICVTFLHLW